MAERRQRILVAAQELARRQGLLGSRVAEIAVAAQVSVGTFYAHFESKEDLIVALAVESWRHRLREIRAVEQIPGLEDTASDHLVAAVVMEFLHGLDFPELLAAEQLAGNESVWSRSGERTVTDMEEAHRKIVEHLAGRAEVAIEEGSFTAPGSVPEHARLIDRGIWTLGAGAATVWHAVAHLERTDERLPAWFRSLLAALLAGLGWRADEPEREIERVAARCIEARSIAE